jgi:UV excision repair protein RAD23
VRYALTVARGNGDLAVEFLTNGIPDQLRQPRSGPGAHLAPGTVTGSGGPLAQLRSHPQFAQLQALVQANPAAIDQVLEAIGQQDPTLLATIHANHDEFVAMMNEPIGQASPQVAPQAHGHPGGMPGGPPNMAQVIQMLQMMPPQARAQALQGMGLGPQQQQQFNQLLALPPEQLQMALGAMGAMGGPGGPMGAPQQGVIHLSAEELASVRRLQELGFTEQEAAQAFLACDKNEGLAANFLLEGGFGDDDDGGFGDDGGDGGDGDDMYN